MSTAPPAPLGAVLLVKVLSVIDTPKPYDLTDRDVFTLLEKLHWLICTRTSVVLLISAATPSTYISPNLPVQQKAEVSKDDLTGDNGDSSLCSADKQRKAVMLLVASFFGQTTIHWTAGKGCKRRVSSHNSMAAITARCNLFAL